MYVVSSSSLFWEGKSSGYSPYIFNILINLYIPTSSTYIHSYFLYYFMILQSLHNIAGLKYIPNFINHSEKQMVFDIVNGNKWCDRLMRAQQYYGIKYFQTKLQDGILQPTVSNDHYPLDSLQFLIDKSIKNSLFSIQYPPNQILVNRYYKSDRLGLHVEDTSAFGAIIVGISLGSTDYLRLVHTDDKDRSYLLELQDRSCYLLSGEARYNYRHGIGRVVNNAKYKDERFQRISLTLRHVIDSRRKVNLSQISKD